MSNGGMLLSCATPSLSPSPTSPNRSASGLILGPQFPVGSANESGSDNDIQKTISGNDNEIRNIDSGYLSTRPNGDVDVDAVPMEFIQKRDRLSKITMR